MSIGRTLFWFRDGNEQALALNDRFFAYGTLLNRLLNEHYSGKKLQFININFSSQKTYDLYPDIPKESAYHYGRDLQYYGFIDFKEFGRLTEDEQDQLIWEKACTYLQHAAETIGNTSLSEASKHAYSRGLEINLNPDYRMLDAELTLHQEIVRASVWVNFRKDGMYSKLTVERNNVVLFEKEIDKTKNGVEFFLEMYRKIESDGTKITVKGRKASGGNLPLTIPISKETIAG